MGQDTSTSISLWVQYWETWDDAKSANKHSRSFNDIDHDLTRYILHNPDKAVITFDRILASTENEEVIGMVGAGPLEDFLGSDYGITYVQEVINRAKRDRKWRFAFGCVWSHGFKDKKVAAQIEKSLDKLFPDGRL